jgi:NAD(P)H-dependent nitrite reductase small subunit
MNYDDFYDEEEETEEIKFPEMERDGTTYLQVCKSDELFKNRGKNIFFDYEVQVAIFRVVGEKLYAVSNICPHQHAPVISEGYIDEDMTVTCPLHGWIYSIETGRALGGHTKLKTYKVFEEDNLVWLEKPKPEIPKWAQNL